MIMCPVVAAIYVPLCGVLNNVLGIARCVGIYIKVIDSAINALLRTFAVGLKPGTY